MTDSSIPLVSWRKRSFKAFKKRTLFFALRSQLWVMSRVAPDRAATRLAALFTTPPRARVRLWERTAMAQASYARERFERLGFLSVYRWRETELSQLPKVLLMHGFGGRASQLGEIAVSLKDAGFEVIAFDAPAHGESGGTRTALPEFVDALEHLAAREGPFEAVIGHSMGAAAVATALRSTLRTNHAVLIAPPAHPGRYLSKLGRALGASERVIGRSQKRIETHYGRDFDDFRTPLNATALNQPALILHDANDNQVPVSEGQAVAEAWQEAQWEVTEGLGHNRILRDPGTMALIQRFLQEQI